MSYIVVAVSAKYPELRLMISSVMSQWGDPQKFPTKDAAREAAKEWAGVFGAEDRRIVIRPWSDSDRIAFPEQRPAAAPPRRRIIVRRST